MKPKYKIGDKVYKLYSDSKEHLIDCISTGNNPIEEFVIDSFEVTITSSEISSKDFITTQSSESSISYFSKDFEYIAEESTLTTNKQDLINKANDVIIYMERNLNKVKNELKTK